MKVTATRILAIFIFSLISIDSYSQNWEKVGKDGEWGSITDVIAMNGYLYSIEIDGTLYKTDKNGQYQQVGEKGIFQNVH